MKSARPNPLLIAAFAFALAALVGAYLAADQQPVIRQNPKLVAAADLAYKYTKADYDAVANTTLDQLCVWSKRLMDAELSNGVGKKAIDNHVDRMRQLHEVIAAKFKHGSASATKLHTAEYFLLEAEGLQAR